MTIHSSIFACKIPGIEEPGNSLWGCKELDTTEQLNNNNNYYHSAKISIITLTETGGSMFTPINRLPTGTMEWERNILSLTTQFTCTHGSSTAELRDVFMTPVYR